MNATNRTAPPARTRIHLWNQHVISRACAAVALTAVLLGAPGDLWAQSANSATCTFIEIKATNDPGGIDPQLKRLAGKLKKPPFASWKTFRMLAKQQKRLARMKAQDMRLKLGGKLSALYRQGTQSRVSLSLTLDDKNGKRALDTKVNADAGDYVVIGYSLPDGNGHVMAISCRVP